MLLVTHMDTHMSDACVHTHVYTHSPKETFKKPEFIGKGTVGSPGEGSRTLITLFPLLQIKKLLQTGE